MYYVDLSQRKIGDASRPTMIKSLKWIPVWVCLLAMITTKANAQAGTLGFYLNGVAYPNGSTVLRSDIGEGANALQCTTDSIICCSNSRGGLRAGEFYMPDGTLVPPLARIVNGYYRFRGSMYITLNRQVTATITGQFRCEIPDASGMSVYLLITIVADLTISTTIIPLGANIAGEVYSLECSINVIGSTDQPTITWLDPMGDPVPSGMINTTNSTSILVFNPLAAAHAGTYICAASLGSVSNNETVTITVNTPIITVSINPSDATPMVGSVYSLTCIITGAERFTDYNTTYQWFKDGMVVAVQEMQTLSFPSLTISDAGSYACTIVLSSNLLNGPVSSNSDPFNVILSSHLPPPTDLMATATTSSISLTWEQPDAVDQYEINYSYVVNECNSEGSIFPPISIRVYNGSLRQYNLTNSPSSPIEEDSIFNISLTAINSVTRSEPSETIMVATSDAAPGMPQSLRTASISVSNITIQWDRVNCLNRNGPIDSYVVFYYPTSNPNDIKASSVFGTRDGNRMFSIIGLPPRTSYTFEVEAINPLLRGVFGVQAIITVNTTAPQSIGFLLGGQLYPNNSVVTLFSGSFLFCLTPNTECCSDSETPKAPSVTREWYLPDGTAVSSSTTLFNRNQVPSAVSLHRSSGTSPSGVFRCEIPDASGTHQNIYVGIYPQGIGSPSITSVLFDRNSTTLTCTSTGGPPTVVTWRKNGAVVNTSNSVYEQSQRLVDAEDSNYESILFNSDVADFVGSFTCEISNVRGTAQLTVELNGVSVIRDQFTVGQSATVTCRSDVLATRIEWLTNGMVLESATSTQQLDLMFSPVNDTIHNQLYTCRVTREGAIIATQNFTTQIEVPMNAITTDVSRSGIVRAGMVYNLTCTVSETVDGLINSPTAAWTTGGVAVSNGNGITLSTINDDISYNSTLIFDPLRTSHDGRYSCNGILVSPALETLLIHSTVEILQVQISTPDVIITVPPGPLFAGSVAPLALTCNISINPATDTDVATMDTDVIWLRGSTRLSNGDARVTISAVSGSRPSFTSTLILNPLSTIDNTTFTCLTRARPPANQQSFITASEMGEGTTSIIVNLPSPPTVSIDPFDSLEIAGQLLKLNCSASIQEGIRGTPVLTWTRPEGFGDLPSEATSAPPLLTFPSLRTSHAGQYTCTARLIIPEAGVDILGASTTNVSIQFMPPPPIISGSPRNTSFFQGLNVIFTCGIILDGVVDTPVTVQGTWNRNGTELMNRDRISITNPLMSSPPYEVILRFNPLNVTDAGTYECDMTVTPQDTTFISTATISSSRTIVVAGFPTQLIDPITAEGTSTAGFSGYTLTCNTSKEPDLPITSTLVMEWFDPRGNVITNRANFSITGSGPTTDNILIGRLTFSNLYTSQAGEYTCRTLQTIPGTVINHPESISFTVAVKLPAPIMTFRRSYSNTLYAGTFFSLTCIITPNTTGVDTNVTVQSSLSIPRSADTERVVISPPMITGGVYEITVTFSHLIEDDTGTYNCSAVVASSSQQNLIIASDPSFGSESISVEPLQSPVVAILGAAFQTAGNQHTLTCTATVNTYLSVTPTIEWSLPESVGNSFITVGGQSTSGAITTKTLTFNPLRTSHGGVYQCTATVNISGFDLQSQTLSRTFRVQVPTPIVSISNPSLPPYNGTNYALTGMVEVDENVDTAVTVTVVWSSNSGPPETISPPYLTSLTFAPLTPNSSRDYTLSVTVRSSGSSAFIQSNTGSSTYNLIVQPLPSHPPIIIVASRGSSPTDGCGEVTTLNCTANQAENLFSPPTISWIAPDGRNVPIDEGSNPRVDSQTKQLIFSGITPTNAGSYMCRATVNIPEAQIVNYFDEATIIASTSDPGTVENLACGRSLSASELTFTWESPNTLQNDVLEYQVQVKELRHRTGTRDVVQFNVANFNTEMRVANVNQGLTAEVPYNITVRAINLAGCGEERQLYCFTQEGVPPPPTNVVVVRFDSTTIGVSWTKFTLVELKGLANYIVTYDIVIGSRKRQLGGMITLPWTQSQVIISDLQPGAEYDIAVRTSTTAGTSAPVGPNDDVSVTTLPPTVGSSDSSSTVAIIGGVVAVAIVLIIAMAATIAFIAFILRNRKSAEFKPSQVPMPYEQPGVLLSDINRVAYNHNEIKSIEADHEYEMLDKYNQAYEEIKVASDPSLAPDPPKLPDQQRLPPSSAGGYDFTQCPAYVPIAHGNQQAETSLTQPAGTTATAAKVSSEVSTRSKDPRWEFRRC